MQPGMPLMILFEMGERKMINKNVTMYFSKVLQQAGVVGLWRGCWPNVGRAALVNLGDLSTYDSVKRGILENSRMEDNTLTHTLSSACAGLVRMSLLGRVQMKKQVLMY